MCETLLKLNFNTLHRQFKFLYHVKWLDNYMAFNIFRFLFFNVTSIWEKMGHNSGNGSNCVETTLHLCTQNMNLFLDLMEKSGFFSMG